MKELEPIFRLDRRVHFPHPPSPSKGMGVVFDAVVEEEDLVDESMGWRRVAI